VRKKHGSILRMTAGVLLVLAPLALAAVGCNGGLRQAEWSELGSESRADRPSRSSRRERDVLRIVPVSNREVARLSPDDIVRVMRGVGFSDAQILELGTDLYSALRLSGGAQLTFGKNLEMLFAVHNQQVHIQSRSRGAFVYDIVLGRFVLGSASSEGGR
jgi:hypothetical protein